MEKKIITEFKCHHALDCYKGGKCDTCGIYLRFIAKMEEINAHNRAFNSTHGSESGKKEYCCFSATGKYGTTGVMRMVSDRPVFVLKKEEDN